MNRIAQLTIALSVLFCIVSCNEKIAPDFPEASNYITVTSQVGHQTKAGYEGGVLPSRFYMNISNPSFEGWMNRDGSSDRYNFPGSNPAWGDADVSNVSVRAITSPDGYDRSTGTMRVSPDQSTASAVEASDLLGASTGNGIMINNNNINITFNHLMSKLLVVYTKPESMTINSIVVKNVCVQGDYSYKTMTYVNDHIQSGDITMYHNTTDKTAEAIFYPFVPSKDASYSPKLVINATIDGGEITLECPILTKASASFDGGKLYMMNIEITGTSLQNAEVTVQGWGSGTDNIQIPGERVLWIGTSIPAGSGAAKSYPAMVDEALNCTIINNAVGSSLVIKRKNADWIDNPNLGWNALYAGGLSQTHQEVEDIYRAKAQNTDYSVDVQNQWIDQVKSLSYESLIIPYINGEKDNCTTVILDHGFNDRAEMILEAGGHQGEGGHVWGYNYLMNLKNKVPGYTYDDYLNKLNTDANLIALNQNYYIVEMSRVIEAIRNVNPNIRIIIGNYFTLGCPYVANEYSWLAADYPNYVNFGSLICYYNEALAGIWDLDIVNVQNYLWLDESAYYAYCPDGVNPTNPDAVRAIADIYIRELDGVIGSRIK